MDIVKLGGKMVNKSLRLDSGVVRRITVRVGRRFLVVDRDYIYCSGYLRWR
jgi:hypothetical protein